jgi:sugar/nucleoside kinase (ribokinase family)
LKPSLAFKDPLTKLIPQSVDVLFANEDETRIFTGFSSEQGCRKLLELCPLVVVTAGEKGCFVGHKEEVHYVPGFPAHAVDTTGAGDHFISGFLYGHLHGLPLFDCARLGNRLGALLTEVIGTELSDWSQVERFLKENHLFRKSS